MAEEREDQPEAQAAEQDTAERAALKRSDVTEVHASPEAPEPAGAPAAAERVDAEPPAAEPAVEETAAAEPAAAEPAPAPQPGAAPPSGDAGGTSPAAADRRAAEDEDAFSERPELYVAAAFVAALVLGKLLKRLTRGKDD
jgi:hypothetical protein